MIIIRGCAIYRRYNGPCTSQSSRSFYMVHSHYSYYQIRHSHTFTDWTTSALMVGSSFYPSPYIIFSLSNTLTCGSLVPPLCPLFVVSQHLAPIIFFGLSATTFSCSERTFINGILNFVNFFGLVYQNFRLYELTTTYRWLPLTISIGVNMY